MLCLKYFVLVKRPAFPGNSLRKFRSNKCPVLQKLRPAIANCPRSANFHWAKIELTQFFRFSQTHHSFTLKSIIDPLGALIILIDQKFKIMRKIAGFLKTTFTTSLILALRIIAENSQGLGA